MPRLADQHLQERIAKEAHRLWRAKGEKGLTLRAVARAAGTTTTTLYKRFRNREALRYAVAERVYRRLSSVLTSAPTVEEVYRRHLHFAETHPREYQLLFGTVWTEIFGPGRDRPIQTWLLAQLTARFGGDPRDYIAVHAALFLTTHGAASMLAAAPNHRAGVAVRQTCVAVCDALLENVQGLRKKPSV
jgi:AcrR family transcriptional regulator